MKLEEAREQVRREHPEWSAEQKIQAIKELLQRQPVDPDSHTARWTACQAEVAAAHPELSGRELKKAIMAEWRRRSAAAGGYEPTDSKIVGFGRAFRAGYRESAASQAEKDAEREAKQTARDQRRAEQQAAHRAPAVVENGVYTLTSYTGRLVVDTHSGRLTLTRNSFPSKGTVSFSIAGIAGIEIRPGNRLYAGHIRFAVPGVSDVRRGGTYWTKTADDERDRYTLNFLHDQLPHVQELARMIDAHPARR